MSSDRLKDSSERIAKGSTGPTGGSEHHVQKEPGAPGRSFGNYTIVGEVSRGSFGVVYRARQKGLNREVALKVLLAGPHASPEAISRFQREARSAARLKHPCIVPIYEIGSENEQHYFAMEFIEGQSLSDRIAQKKVTISDALAIAEALADAMDTAHVEGVIHRDLKPSNVIIDLQGRPRLTDFGLAKQVDLDTRYTQTGTTLGTPAYMPPEQARGEVHKVDARSDVYALGAMLYEMITGRPPFWGRTLLEVVVAVLNDMPRPPRQVNPAVHRDIQTIVMKCLEKDPNNRYATAGALRDDIRRFRSGESILARPAGLPRLMGRFLLRHRAWVATAAIGLLAAGVTMYQFKVSREEIQHAEEEARKSAEETRKKVEQEKAREEIESAQSGWKRVWWWALNPETAGDYRIDDVAEPEKVLFTQGMAHPNQSVVDWVDGKRLILTPRENLVSPEEKRVFGDMEATLTFRLSPQAASSGIRVGLQSYEGGIPYVLTIKPNLLSLCAPTDLYILGNGPRFMPRLLTKAEKPGPDLTAGDYRLFLRREGMRLDFVLNRIDNSPASPEPTKETVAVSKDSKEAKDSKDTKPVAKDSPDTKDVKAAKESKDPVEIHDPHEVARLSIWDIGLSHWKFKNTVLSVRNPPAGFEMLSVDMFKKVAPRKSDDLRQALSFLYSGEYNGAADELNALTEKAEIDLSKPETAAAELLKIARAKYYVGVIQEICHSTGKYETRYYGSALDTLARLPADSVEARELETLILVRRIVRGAGRMFYNGAAQNSPGSIFPGVSIPVPNAPTSAVTKEQWERVRMDLDRLAQLLGASTKTLTEPWCWELAPLLAEACKRRDEESISFAFAAFPLVGVAPGAEWLDQPVLELGKTLSSQGRVQELQALYKLYPNKDLSGLLEKGVAAVPSPSDSPKPEKQP